VTVAEVIGVIDALAPPGYAFDWDRSGLRIGAPDKKVKNILVTLTVTPDAFKAAKKNKADLIVAHHPPLWEPLTTLRTDNIETELWVDVAASGMACYAAHTNLDIAPNGVNDVLADKLGLVNRSPLFPTPHVNLVKVVVFVPDTHVATVREAMAAAGAGLIGEYASCSFSVGGTGTFLPSEKTDPHSGKRSVVNEEPERRMEMQVHEARLAGVVDAMKEAHPYEEVAFDVYPMNNPDPYIGLGVRGELEKSMSFDAFSKMVREALKTQHVRTIGAMRSSITTVGVMGGAGGSMIANVPDGIDAFVTGDVTYHDAQHALDRGLAVVDAGHNGTEKWIVPHLAKYLRGKLKDAKVATFTEPDPFHAVVE